MGSGQHATREPDIMNHSETSRNEESTEFGKQTSEQPGGSRAQPLASQYSHEIGSSAKNRPALEHSDIFEGPSWSSKAEDGRHVTGSAVSRLQDVLKPRKKKKERCLSKSDDHEVTREEKNQGRPFPQKARIVNENAVMCKKKKRKTICSFVGQDDKMSDKETEEND